MVAKKNAVVDLSKSEAGIIALAEKHAYTPEQLDALLPTIEGNKEVKAAKKELTSTRTALTALHKELKAPIVAAGKLLDAQKKDLNAKVLEIEKPIDAAIARHQEAQANDALAEQAAEIAALKAQLAKKETIIEEAHITEVGGECPAEESDFEYKQLCTTAKNRSEVGYLNKLFGVDAVEDLKQGGKYGVELVLRRVEK